MTKGKLIISLDTEYAWGRISDPECRDFYPLYAKTHSVINELINTFDKYNAPVTWAIVGRLVDGGREKNKYFNKNLSEFFPNINTKEIYSSMELNNPQNSFVIDENLIERIMAAKVIHEIATHTYNHIFYDRITDAKIIDEDLKASIEVIEEKNTNVESMVFTKNQIGFKEILKKNGIQTYRGGYEKKYARLPTLIQRFLLLIDNFIPTSPKLVEPQQSTHSLVEIPGSMLYRQSPFGIRKYFPLGILTNKIISGLNRAAKEKKILHIWIHPYNFGYKQK